MCIHNRTVYASIQTYLFTTGPGFIQKVSHQIQKHFQDDFQGDTTSIRKCCTLSLLGGLAGVGGRIKEPPQEQTVKFSVLKQKTFTNIQDFQ